MAESFNRQVSESEASVLNEALDDRDLRAAIQERILTLDALTPETREKVGVHTSGFLLAGAAGLINAVAFARYTTYVSHVSGSATAFGLRANGDQPGDVPTPAVLVLDFIVGSFICGMFIPKATLKIGKAPYTSALLLLSLVTTLGWLTASKQYDPDASATQFLGPHWLAIACGLQNGLCSAWSGNVLRTTHVTGTATDLGLAIGRIFMRFLKKGSTKHYESADWDDHVVDRQKMVIMTVLLAGFVIGAWVGAEMFNVVGLHTLLVASGLQAGLGIAHAVVVSQTKEEIQASVAAEAGFQRQLSPMKDKEKEQVKAGSSYEPMVPKGLRGA